MSELGKIIPLTAEEKELYCKLDFKFFLDQNLDSDNVSAENRALIQKGYKETRNKIQIAKSINKTQYHLFLEGYVRKMHSGGMLPSHFNLSEAREFKIVRFEDYGENWAYFEEWSKREKYQFKRKKIWNRLVEIGALIGFILGAIRLYEVFKG